MADAARWRKWKPSGTAPTKPAAEPALGGFGGFVSFVGSEKNIADKAAVESEEGRNGAQDDENKAPDAGLADGRDRRAGGFVSFGGFVSRHPSTSKGDDGRGIPWAEWKAQALNRLFLELTGRRGNITAATVRHGERKWREQLSKKDKENNS
jgi:hypothetical protein